MRVTSTFAGRAPPSGTAPPCAGLGPRGEWPPGAAPRKGTRSQASDCAGSRVGSGHEAPHHTCSSVPNRTAEGGTGGVVLSHRAAAGRFVRGQQRNAGLGPHPPLRRGGAAQGAQAQGADKPRGARQAPGALAGACRDASQGSQSGPGRAQDRGVRGLHAAAAQEDASARARGRPRRVHARSEEELQAAPARHGGHPCRRSHQGRPGPLGHGEVRQSDEALGVLQEPPHQGAEERRSDGACADGQAPQEAVDRQPHPRDPGLQAREGQEEHLGCRAARVAQVPQEELGLIPMRWRLPLGLSPAAACITAASLLVALASLAVLASAMLASERSWFGEPAQRSSPAPRVYGNERGKDVHAPVATVLGQPISKATLSDFWFDRYPEEYGRTLDTLVDERIVIADAHRSGVRVPAVALAKAVEKEVEARREQLTQLYGDAVDIADEVKRAYGVGLAEWKRSILGPRLHARLLMERVIRWDSHRRPRLHARVIVLPTAAKARTVVEKLRRGADFSLTALNESMDPLEATGGNLPPFGRGDLAFPGVEKRLFAAAQGALVGPLEVQVGGKPQWQIYRIVNRLEAWPGNFESNWERIEKDLAERPMAGPEYERWRVRARRDAKVGFYRPDGRPWEPLDRR